MVTALRLLAIFAGVACPAMIGFAAEPKEPPKPKVEIRWVERFRVEGLTVDRIVGDSGDSPGYYPHAKPAMILTAKDIVEARLEKFDWLMGGVVVHHYSVTLVLTKDARERLAKSCPRKSAAITVCVDGSYSGWSHYTTDNDAKVSEDLKAKNYNPSWYLGTLALETHSPSCPQSLVRQGRSLGILRDCAFMADGEVVPQVDQAKSTRVGDAPGTDSVQTRSLDPGAVSAQAGEKPSAAMPEQIGRYRILKLLGEGAFGRVWLAQDDELQREVAIKVPQSGSVVPVSVSATGRGQWNAGRKVAKRVSAVLVILSARI